MARRASFRRSRCQRVIRIARPEARDNYGLNHVFAEVFLKKLSFYAISNQVLDFSGLKHDIADLYARGFASL